MAYAYDGWKTLTVSIVADIANIAADKCGSTSIVVGIVNIIAGIETSVIADLVIQV